MYWKAYMHGEDGVWIWDGLRGVYGGCFASRCITALHAYRLLNLRDGLADSDAGAEYLGPGFQAILFKVRRIQYNTSSF
jgi:hypothetical protein